MEERTEACLVAGHDLRESRDLFGVTEEEAEHAADRLHAHRDAGIIGCGLESFGKRSRAFCQRVVEAGRA